MSDSFDISSLEGWLLKKKTPGKQGVMSLLSGDTRRWFQVKELVNSDRVDFTLCYFKSRNETEARGWIYLSDVTDLYANGKTITIVSLARSITIEANSRAEHKFWLEGITSLCPHARQGEVQSPADEKSRSISSSPGISVRGSTDLKADTKGSMDTIEMDDRRIRIAESKESLKPSSQPNSARSSVSDQNGDPSTHRGGSQNNHKDQTGNNRSNRFDREGSKEKDDHRMATYSKSPLRSSGCATSRLHNHIRNDAPSNSSSAPPQKSSKKETLRQSEPHDAKGTDKPPESLSDCYDDDIETLNISAESSPSRSNRQRLATRNERRDRQFSTSSEDERAFVNSDTTNTPHQKYAAELEIDAETAKNHRSSLIQNNRSRDSKRGDECSDDEDNKGRADLKVERITRTFSQIQSIDGKIDHENVKPSRSLTTNSDGNNPGPVTRGRPPLPPNGTKPNPYITLSKIQPSSSTSSILSRPADNEIIHDNGFANEDWDDDDDVNMNTERTKENRRSQDLTNPRMNSSASQPVNTVPSSGVRADSNWLKENFDED